MMGVKPPTDPDVTRRHAEFLAWVPYGHPARKRPRIFEVATLDKAKLDQGIVWADARYGGIVGGWYDSTNHLVVNVQAYWGVSVYITLNPAKPVVLARDPGVNRLGKIKNRTTDEEIDFISNVPIDVDIKHAVGTSATTAEVTRALARRDDILSENPHWLDSAVWGCSGNGGYVHLKTIGYPNTPETAALVETFYQLLKERFDDPGGGPVHIDPANCNPARLGPLAGTWKTKGVDHRDAYDAAESRPWRPVTLIGAPTGVPVPLDLQAEVARLAESRPVIVDMAASETAANGKPAPVNGKHPSATGKAPKPAPKGDARQGRVGDDFNARTTWEEVLEPYGCQKDGPPKPNGEQHWTRPGKSGGCSLTTGHCGDQMHVFTSNFPPFKEEDTCDKFGAYVRLAWKGDFQVATRELAKQGYGASDGNGRHASNGADHRGPSWVGLIVKAHDRDNFGDVVEDYGDSCLVHFESHSGHEAEKVFPKSELTLMNPPPGFSSCGADLSTLGAADLGIVRASDITPERVEFEFGGRIALNKFNLLGSEGGDGKSQLTCLYAAIKTKGGTFPGESTPAKQCDVAFMTAEDDPKDTGVPRLMAVGADLDRVHFLAAKVTVKDKRGRKVIHPQSLQDLEYFRTVFTKVLPGVKFLVIDPIPAYLGRGVNDSSNNELRAVLEPFMRLCGESGITVVGITHLSKAVDFRSPIDRILGSVAYKNLARVVAMIGRDKENEDRRILVQVKNNLARKAPAMAYEIQGARVTYNDVEIDTAKVVLDPREITTDAMTLFGGGARGPKPAKSLQNAEWLFDVLSTGEKAVQTIISMAKSDGVITTPDDPDAKVSLSPLYNARDRLPQARPGFHVVEDEKPADDHSWRNLKFWSLEEIPYGNSETRKLGT
jgi:putative DNA primase/helicase